MKHSIRRRTSDADQYADHGTWYDEAGYGDRNAADYQCQHHPGRDGAVAQVPKKKESELAVETAITLFFVV